MTEPLKKERRLKEASLNFPSEDAIAVKIARIYWDVFNPSFIPWLVGNTNVFMMFDKTANKLWEEGLRKYSARGIVELMRDDFIMSELRFNFTVLHKWSGDLSRLYALLHPDRKEMFNYSGRDIDFNKYIKKKRKPGRSDLSLVETKITEEGIELIDLAERYDDVFRNTKFLPWLKTNTHLALMFINTVNRRWDVEGKRFLSARALIDGRIRLDCSLSNIPFNCMYKFSSDLARLYALKNPRRVIVFKYGKREEDKEFYDLISTIWCDL